MTQDWINEVIDKISLLGKTDAGVFREAFTDAEEQARDYIVDLMEDAGLRVRKDEIGNIIGRLETGHALPAVATGSHLDTVPGGGKYDGVVGVVGGLAAIMRLKDKPLKHPLELIVFAAEESSRFALATIGSKTMAGRTNLTAWKKAKDQNNISLPKALESRGLDINTITKAVRSKGDLKAFIELHIEQGNTLSNNVTAIGIVDIVAAPTRLKITVEGMANHSGTTPMTERRDALVSAAMIILAIQEIGLEQAHQGTVATVGALRVSPGAINVVPGSVEMWVDIRGVNHDSIIETLQDIKDAVSTVADGQDTSVAIEMLSSDKPVKMDPGIIQEIKNVCFAKNLPHTEVHSGAGHDAMNMALIAPTGMIFIPTQDGISHNADEYASPRDIENGIDVLTETIYRLAK